MRLARQHRIERQDRAVGRPPTLDHPPEIRENGPAGEAKEMARAGAAAGSESRDRNARLRQAFEHFRPLVLSGNGVGGEPDGPQGRNRPHKVYVPMRPGRPAPMVPTACPKTTGAEGAADIPIPTHPDVEDAELSHLDPPGARTIEDEGIGARSRRELSVHDGLNTQERHTIVPCLRQRFP